MKKLLIILSISAVMIWVLSSCAASDEVNAKSGAQLWGENCIRCHNAPPASQFNDNEWISIATHMEVVADLTADETEKIIEFLTSSN